MILGLAAFAGLRAHEIAQLDWVSIDLAADEPQIRVEEGKDGKGRRVPLSQGLIEILRGLPNRRGPVITRIDGEHRPNSAARISQRANYFLHDMGISATLHQCRHRFATVTYQACLDLRAVQGLLGHASPQTTAIYAAASSAVARSAVEAAGAIAQRHSAAVETAGDVAGQSDAGGITAAGDVA